MKDVWNFVEIGAQGGVALMVRDCVMLLATACVGVYRCVCIACVGPHCIWRDACVQVLFYIFQESQEIWKSGPKEYFKNFWNTMDIANLVLFLAIFYLRITTTFEIQTTVLEHAAALTSPQV